MSDFDNIKKAISNIYDLPEEAIVPEFFDVFKIVSMGAKKYAMNNWLNEDGKRSSEKEMHDSMFHHLAESFKEGQEQVRFIKKHLITTIDVEDYESGLDPLLHIACRALMLYTRRQRGIVHTEDKK